METESHCPRDTAHEALFGIPVVAVIGLPLLALLIVLFLGFGFVMQSQQAQFAKTYSARAAEFLAYDLAGQLEKLLTPAAQYVDDLAATIERSNCTAVDCVFAIVRLQKTLSATIPGQITFVGFGGSNGNLFGISRPRAGNTDFLGTASTSITDPTHLNVTSPGSPTVDVANYNVTERGWYQAGAVDPEPVWSAPYKRVTLGRHNPLETESWRLTRVARINTRDGKLLGVIVADISLNRIAAFLQGMTGRTLQKVSILSRSGETISIENGELSIVASSEAAANATVIDRSIYKEMPLTVENLKGWRLAVTLSPQMTEQAAWSWKHILALLGGLLVSIMLAAIAASFVVKPLMKLSRAVTDVGDLKLDTPIAISSGIREIGLLASVIERMRSVLHRNQTSLEFLAYHDPVTGFLNRAGLVRAFDLAKAKEGQIDLILIKVCNGHQIAGIFGDAVLTRLLVNKLNVVQAMFEGGVVGCLNSNQIACIYQSGEGTDAAHMQKVLATMRLPYEDNGIRILLNVAGAVSSKHSQTEIFDCILRRANAAMHYAEETQSEDAVWYNPALMQDLRAVLDFGGDITPAIARGEFSVLYQPIVELRTGRIFEAQASVVWHHPEFGDIRSHKFIPILERNGSIRHLGLFVMSQAFEFLHHFRIRSPDKKLRVGVKLSFAQLMDPLFVERVTELQAEWNISARQVNFIITQDTAMLGDQQIFRVMRKLRKLGFSLTIDQFAMAHSTVNGSTALQYDGMMIGSDVYRGIEQPGVERIILEAACELARKLGMERIAVGIDNHAIIDPLIECGCTFGRGPWFGKSSTDHVFMARYDENAAMFADEAAG